MIPRIIHYIWLGSELPAKNREIVEEWQKLMPDYTFKFWGDELMKDCKLTYLKQAWRKKGYAFISDYFRLQIIHQYGGYYLDSDMKMLKRLDDLENNHFVICSETEELINWAFFGSEPGNPFLKACTEKYHIEEFDVFKPLVIPYFLNDDLREYLKTTDKPVLCLDSPYFYPMPMETPDQDYQNYLTPESYGVHLWDFSWNKMAKKRPVRKEIFYRLRILFLDLLSFRYSPYYFRMNIIRIQRLIKRL